MQRKVKRASINSSFYIFNNEINNFKNKLKHLIDKYPTIDITVIDFPTDWEDEPLWSHCTTSEKYC